MSYSPIPEGTVNWDVPLNAALTDQDQRISDNASQIAVRDADISSLKSRGLTPSDQGLVAWPYDPILCAAGTGALTSGTLYLHSFKIGSSVVSQGIVYSVNAVAVTPTAGQNFMGIYSPAGGLLAQTADLSTDWLTAGNKSATWTTPINLPPGVYYAGLLTNAATGVNLWKTASGNANVSNINLAAASYRTSSGGTGLTGITALPATITMSNRSVGANDFWFGLI